MTVDVETELRKEIKKLSPEIQIELIDLIQNYLKSPINPTEFLSDSKALLEPSSEVS